MQSVDFFRGFTMFLLIGEFSGLFEALSHPPLDGPLADLVLQFHHHPWDGLRFWDLIQPFFMVIVGVSLALSVHNRVQKGASQKELHKHVLQRSLLLLLLGWGLYCIDDGSITWRFQNVLAQLAFTYPSAYLLMRKSFRFQLVFSLLILLAAEVLYRWPFVSGFDQPFVAGQNIGEWIELQLNGKIPGGHWVSINALSTSAHTIWGVLIGKWLLGAASSQKKLKMLLLFGIVALTLGYGLSPITPIIKRIATSSFVLVSGGWTLLFMALSYWLIDLRQKNRFVLFFAVVGMNPLFIYLFAHVGGAGLLERIIHPFSYALTQWGGTQFAAVFTSVLVWAALWGICRWLYTQKLFFRI
jgi:predicted acyltransferase